MASDDNPSQSGAGESAAAAAPAAAPAATPSGRVPGFRSGPNSVSRIISAGRANPDLLAQLEKFRQHLTVMFGDIGGSTSYFEKHGDIAGMMMVHECHEQMRVAIEANGGHFIKTI